MIRVRYSNRVEELVRALADALPPPGDRDGLFDGPWLVIPSRPLELYVNLELARRRGIAGTIDTVSVNGAFARLCARALPEVTLIERGHVIGELLALLSDEATLDADPVFGDLRGYLAAAGPAPDAVNRRRIDVARALGALFHEWSLTRPELMTAWRAAAVGAERGDSSGDSSGLVRAERALWTALFRPGGRFDQRGALEGRRYLTLDAIFAENLDAAWLPPPALHLFGLSRVPRGLQLALARLGNKTAVAVYAVNPCREFWEDLDTRARQPPVREPAPGRRRRASAAERTDSRQLAFAALTPPTGAASNEPAERDNPLLRAWGHAGRESTRLLNQLSDGDFDGAFVAPVPEGGSDGGGSDGGGGSLLAHLQQDMLDRRPARRDAQVLNLPADGSVMIRGAPNPRRELETIAGEIWALVRGGAGLRFSDIAVLIAGGDEPYLSLAPAVFREADDLPHAIVDQTLAHTSHLAEAVLALLDLPRGTFTRREVLDVITHPQVRARFPEADPHTWLRLCEGLAIAHGVDQAALSDTYIDDDRFNWDQGLKRLALGVFARGPRSGADDGVLLPGAPRGYVPAEVASDLRSDADAMALLVRSLLADARFARSARLSLPDWMGFVRALMAAYLVAVTPEDEQARLRVFTALDEIAAQAPPALTVPLGTAAELVRTALTGLRGTRGQMLGAGVAVGTVAALRTVPFRVIFVAGLAADRFPGADRPSPFEVAAALDNPGAPDVTPRQQDRYSFLETLLAAREVLVLSHVDRDAVTGDVREPSPLVLELLDEVRRGYLQPGVSLVQSVPLHRDEDPRILRAFPAAAAEARARDLGAALQDRVPGAAGMGAGEIIRALSPRVRERLAGTLKTIAPIQTIPPIHPRDGGRASISPSCRPEEARVLRLIDLRRFLECPLQGSARVFLGLRDLPDDTEARETGDEPFEVPRWMERTLLGEVFAAAWTTDAPPDVTRLSACYDQAVTRHRHGRLFPAGLFRSNVRRRHLRVLEQWLQSVRAHADGNGNGNGASGLGPLRPVCFGRPEPSARPAERRPPLRLTVALPEQGVTQVELHGTTEPQLTSAAGRGSLVLATSPDRERNDKDSLRAFLDHVALAASLPEDEPPHPFVGVLARPSRDAGLTPPQPLVWAPLERSVARAYLTALLGELLAGVHAYLFPCEAVFRSYDGQMSLVDRIDQVRADRFYREQSSSNWGPVPEPFDHPTPEAALAERYATARFGLWGADRPPPRPRSRRGSS